MNNFKEIDSNSDNEEMPINQKKEEIRKKQKMYYMFSNKE